MKSTVEQLENRGFVANDVEKEYADTSFEQRLCLLKSNFAKDRTLGARLLAQKSCLPAINQLIEALIKENKLYPKLDICNSLATYGNDAVVPLIELLGKVGNNQYKKVPEKSFGKDNYPLPRDIAGRILIRIGSSALPDLLKVIKSCDLCKLSEAIDAIGFICFYEKQPEIFIQLKECFHRNLENDLIKWKLFRAMSAFPESETILKEQQGKINNKFLTGEISRSLRLIQRI
jgi:hypothetical protein